VNGCRANEEAEAHVRAVLYGSDIESHRLDYHWNLIEMVLLIGFTLELSVRALAQEGKFFNGSDKYSNFVDVLLLVDLYIAVFAGGHADFAFLQFLRPLRIIRILRIIKFNKHVPESWKRVRWMRFFNDLFSMVEATMRSISALVPVILLLAMVLYMLSLCTVSGVAAYALELKEPSANVTCSADSSEMRISDRCHGNDARIKAFEIMVNAYGSVPDAMYTLLQAYAGLIYPSEFYNPVLEMRTSAAVLFFIFWLLVQWVVANVVIGEVCNVISQARMPDSFQSLQSKLEAEQEKVETLMGLFESPEMLERRVRARSITSSNRQGKVDTLMDLQELDEVLKDPHVIFRLGLGRHEARSLHKCFDTNNRGVLVKTFIEGAVRLQRPTQYIDLYALHQDVKELLACRRP